MDGIVPPELSTEYAVTARRVGDAVEIEIVEGAGHFELVNPGSQAWPAVMAAVRKLFPAPPQWPRP